MEMTPATMDFHYRDHFGQAPPDAYERLLADALLGDQTLFLRGDEIEASLEVRRRGARLLAVPGRTTLEVYEAGGWGPEDADHLSGSARAASRG